MRNAVTKGDGMAPDDSTASIATGQAASKGDRLKKEKPIPPDIWNELHGYYYEELELGMSAVLSRTVQATDIANFAGVSGDTNPVHLSEEFAANTIVEGRICHGILTASFISALIGTKLPGPGCLYVSQSLRFKGPVRIGDTVNTRVTISELQDEKGRAILWCECFVGDTIMLEGEAVVQITKRHPD